MNGMSGRIFQDSRCSLLRRAGKHFVSMWDQGTGVDPNQLPTPTRTPKGPETGKKRGCAGLDLYF